MGISTWIINMINTLYYKTNVKLQHYAKEAPKYILAMYKCYLTIVTSMYCKVLRLNYFLKKKKKVYDVGAIFVNTYPGVLTNNGTVTQTQERRSHLRLSWSK